MQILDIEMDIIEEKKESKYNDFISEFAEGYLGLETVDKKERLEEYLRTYKELTDKDSFKAQYLKTLIDLLIEEI